MDGGEDCFCIDSKPIEVCRIARSKRCSMGKKDFSKAPGVGYCASQSMYYYGYKLHAVCGLSGVIHSFDLTKASVHDIHYLGGVWSLVRIQSPRLLKMKELSDKLSSFFFYILTDY